MLAGGLVSGQTFDNASIKPTTAPSTAGSQLSFLPHGELMATRTTLRALIALAYEVPELQIAGGPPGMAIDLYEVAAKADDADPDPNNSRGRQRLQALLADRFGLKVHRETKDVGLYVLLPGKDESKLQRATRLGSMSAGPGLLQGVATMEGIAKGLSVQLGRMVVDETGIKGLYVIKLEWTQRETLRPSAGPLAEGEPPRPGSVFAAVVEQLGLKLEARNQQRPVIVVERAERLSNY